MDESTKSRAIQVLLDFFAEMHRLGIDGLRYLRSIDPEEGVDVDQYAEFRAVERRRLEAIFSRYCSEGLKAQRLRDAHMAHRDPPRYDPEHEAVIEVAVDEGSVIIETFEDVEAEWYYQYEIVQQDGTFLIKDNKKFRLGSNSAWKPHLL